MLLHEIDLEKNVIDPLNHVENEAANIAKARRNLNKLILDMDSARTRFVCESSLLPDLSFLVIKKQILIGTAAHRNKRPAEGASPKWMVLKKRWKKLS